MCGRLIGSMLSQRFQIIALLVASGLVALGGESASPPPGAEVSISALPFLNNGVREYPTPFLAVARTPTLIPPLGAVIGLQDNLGCLAGFGGLVDAATGRVGFPATNAHFRSTTRRLGPPARLTSPAMAARILSASVLMTRKWF